MNVCIGQECTLQSNGSRRMVWTPAWREEATLYARYIQGREAVSNRSSDHLHGDVMMTEGCAMPTEASLLLQGRNLVAKEAEMD